MNHVSVVSPYGGAIVCAVGGFVLSRMITRYVIDLSWRRVIFSVGIAAAVLYLGVYPRGSDQWVYYAAIWSSGGVLLGWVAGFGIAMFPRPGRRFSWIVAVLALVTAGTPTVSAGARAAPACRTGQLSLRATFRGAALGEFVQTLTVSNVGAHACEIGGWPRIQVEDVAGHQVLVPVRRVVQTPAHAKPFREVVVEPQGAASFNLYGADFDAVSGRGCPVGVLLSVRPPGAQGTLHVRANVPRCRYGYYISPLIGGSNDRLAWTFVWHK